MGPDIVDSCKNILESLGIDSDRVEYYDDEENISLIEDLKPFKSNVDKIPDTKAPMGRALNAAQILMAQPDEVWNFGRGDGLEKALCFMNIIRGRRPEANIQLKGDRRTICVSLDNAKEYTFQTEKEVDLPGEKDFPF